MPEITDAQIKNIRLCLSQCKEKLELASTIIDPYDAKDLFDGGENDPDYFVKMLASLYNLVIHNNDGTMTKLCRTKRVAEVKLYEYVLDNWHRIYESGDLTDEERETWEKLAADGVPYPMLNSNPLNSVGLYFELMKETREIQIVTLIVDETFKEVDNTPKG